jgi:hypothetical protein
MTRPAIVPNDNEMASALSFATLGQRLCGGSVVSADLIVPTTVGGE